MTQVLSTRDVPPRERLAYWTDLICDVYVQLDCVARGAECFQGSIACDTLASLQLSVVESNAQHVLRTHRQIARASEDYFLVSIQSRGTGVVRQDGREALLAPGDFALYDSTRPYQLLFDGPFQQIVLMLPGEDLRSRLRQTEALTATAVSGRRGAGHLLIDMVRTLRADISALQPASALAVAEGVVHILVAGLRTLPAANRQPPSDLSAYHLARIKAYVREHLDDPQLSVRSVCAALGLSPGHVHRLFRDEPLPLAHHVRELRLAACRRDLADPRHAHRGVAEIAFARGFNDAAHFSRAFRERYGTSPRDWRAQALRPPDSPGRRPS